MAPTLFPPLVRKRKSIHIGANFNSAANSLIAVDINPFEEEQGSRGSGAAREENLI
jgi:hypothetical protein